MPRVQAGQRFCCPRCGADFIAPGETGAEPAVPADAATSEPSPVSLEETLPPAPHAKSPLEDEEFGISCLVCGTRLHVRRSQIGTTVQCPDCYSPVEVKAPSKRRSPAATTWTASGNSGDDDSARKAAAQAMLDKARVAQEEEATQERERSAERFTEGLFDFFADPQALVRLAILAIWFALATTLFRAAMGMTISESMPAILSEAISMVVLVVLAVVFLTFLAAAAACALAVVNGTSDGMRRIEHWPGFNFFQWGSRVLYVLNAGFMAASPGALFGLLLGLVGISGAVLYTAAASFLVMFPPILLSMFESNSALAPFSSDAWSSIRERPDPWKLMYLITSVVIIGGLFALVTSLLHGSLLGFAGAVLTVTSMMLYFRTVGRLFCILGGRDVERATGNRKDS